MSIRRHAAYNLAGSLAPIVLSLVTVPLYLKLIGPERYGVLAIAWILLGYFGLFDLGLGRATSFRIAAQKASPPEARARTFWAALSVNLGMGVVGGLLLWVAARLVFGDLIKIGAALRPEMVAAAPLLAAAVPVATMTGVLTGALQGRERFLEISLISALSTAVFQLAPLTIAWRFGPSLPQLLAGAVAARLLAAAVLALRCHQHVVRGCTPTFDRAEISVLLRYGGWVNLTSIFGPILYLTDRFVIGAMLGARAVTDYTVPYQLASRTAILPSAVTTALFPRLSSADAAERAAMARAATLTLIAVLSPLFLGGIYLMGPFLHAWVGDHLSRDAPVVGRIVLVAMWTNALALVAFTGLQASGRPDRVTKIMLCEIPAYLLALALFTRSFGLVGAGLATAARSLADYLLLTWAARAGYAGARSVAANLCLLGTGVLCAGLWSPSDWRWWGSALILGAASVALGWKTAPADLTASLIDRLPALKPAE